MLDHAMAASAGFCGFCGQNTPKHDDWCPKSKETTVGGLSLEAKVVLGAFWEATVSRELRFEHPYTVDPRAQKGLDELVALGYMTVEDSSSSNETVWSMTDKVFVDKPVGVSRGFLDEHAFPLMLEDITDD